MRSASATLRVKIAPPSPIASGIWVTANKTSVAYSGYDVGRRLIFDNRDYDRAKDVAGIDHISSQYFVRGGQFGGGEMLTRRGTKASLFQINAVRPETIYLVQNEIIAGRFLNESDLAAKRKSVVVGRPVVDYLFAPNEPPIGQWIIVAGVPFEIVGVFTDPSGDEQSRQLYIPLSTAQISFHGVDHINSLSFTVGAEHRTLPVAVAMLRGRYESAWGQVMAAAVLTTIPIGALVLIFQRWIVRGLTEGAMKG